MAATTATAPSYETGMLDEKRHHDVEKPEKQNLSDEENHVERVESETLVATELEVIELSPEQKRKVMRRLDFILVPQLGILYLLSFLDRGNSEDTT